MQFHVVTLFPEVIDAYAKASILGRAQKEGILSINSYQLRDFVQNPKATTDDSEEAWFYKKVDDKPYGGGPGMVLQAEPFIRAVETICSKANRENVMIYHHNESNIKGSKKIKVLITAAGGKPFTNAYAKKLSKEKEVVLLCGRYEGIDARAKKIITSLGMAVEEVSVGPYVLTGGELPALTIIDTTARQIPGVLGKIESLEESRVASHDVYTRPETIEWQNINGEVKKYKVPKVLLSGHHANIDTIRSKKRNNPIE